MEGCEQHLARTPPRPPGGAGGAGAHDKYVHPLPSLAARTVKVLQASLDPGADQEALGRLQKVLPTWVEEQAVLRAAGCPVPSIDDRIERAQIRLGLVTEVRPARFNVEDVRSTMSFTSGAVSEALKPFIVKEMQRGTDAIIVELPNPYSVDWLDFFWFPDGDVQVCVDGVDVQVSEARPFEWNVISEWYSRNPKVELRSSTLEIITNRYTGERRSVLCARTQGIIVLNETVRTPRWKVSARNHPANLKFVRK